MGVMNNQMGLMNNPHYEELRMTQEKVRMCQAKVAAHARKLEELIDSIKEDSNLEMDTKMEVLRKRNNRAPHSNFDDDEEERLLASLYRNQEAKKEMQRTKEKLSVIKGIINRHLGSAPHDNFDQTDGISADVRDLPGFSDTDHHAP